MALRVELGGHTMEFDTAAGLFSPAHADRGTLAMLACADLAPGQRVLDLGCGWGLAGVYAALARKNARKNGVEGARVYVGDALEAVPDRAFDRILLNPPYQTDFAVAKRLILKSFNRLEIGGKLFMVTKRRTWYLNKLKSVFGGARVRDVDGYFVFEAERRARQYAEKK